VGVLNPDHLLEQAERLISPADGLSREVDRRRAISAAYYAVFHFILTAAADFFAGAENRRSKNYALAYRSIDHRGLRDLCLHVQKSTLPPKYRRYLPLNGFLKNIPAFATAYVELYEKRHEADYDPRARVTVSRTRLAISTARDAISRFQRSASFRQRAFLSLLLFPPR
jgi:uncharacterized protein (UPF0332 family)